MEDWFCFGGCGGGHWVLGSWTTLLLVAMKMQLQGYLGNWSFWASFTSRAPGSFGLAFLAFVRSAPSLFWG